MGILERSSPGECGLGATPPAMAKRRLTHEPETNKGLLLPEPISDTTMCPKGTCDPDRLHFLLSGQKATQSYFPHLHNVKKNESYQIIICKEILARVSQLRLELISQKGMNADFITNLFGECDKHFRPQSSRPQILIILKVFFCFIVLEL